MTEHRFRMLIWAYVAFLCGAAVAGYFPAGYSEELRTAYEAEPSLVDTLPIPVVGTVVLAFLALIIAGLVGMYRFRPWARPLSLWTTLVATPALAALGPSLSSGLEAAMWELSSVFWGALLALAYFSPVANRFRADTSSEPTPLRGAA